MPVYDPTIWDDLKAQQLLLAIAMVENKSQAQAVLADLLTAKEIEELANRLEVARLLRAGCSYDEVQEKVAISTATIARISKWLARGAGGYELVLKNLATKYADHLTHTRPDLARS